MRGLPKSVMAYYRSNLPVNSLKAAIFSGLAQAAAGAGAAATAAATAARRRSARKARTAAIGVIDGIWVLFTRAGGRSGGVRAGLGRVPLHSRRTGSPANWNAGWKKA